MKNHVWRPLYVVLAVVALILVARYLYVPKDFGIGERGFMYGYHRMSNETEWKEYKVKYQSHEYCNDCHPDKIESILRSTHKVIECENCHGPAVDHPEDPPKLDIDRSRAQCLRCHARLPYPTSSRGRIKGIEPDEHNVEMECADCHNPHSPGMGV
ncbi:MAG: cytochrome c3 family protein [Nitrospirota bacterium]|nr:MAG: cytochrome c3 family protein [Nitrospirota bacterium]